MTAERYNQYGPYYDPIGSQPSQRTSYTYHNSSAHSGYQTAPGSAGYSGSNYQSHGDNSDGNQQYGSNGQQTNVSVSHAAAALSSLSGQNCSQASSANAANSGNRYNDSSWPGTSANLNAYSTNSNPTQSNKSPFYPSAQSSSTFGNLSVPEQSQSSSNTTDASQRTYPNVSNAGWVGNSYQNTYNGQRAQPPRYSGPSHAVGARQHDHGQPALQSSIQIPSSPEMSNAAQTGHHNRQQSGSVEPSQATVDPSQVYDNRAELQRQAQIETEKMKKYEAEQAAKAKEERMQEEQLRKEEEDAAKKAKNKQKRKAREDKKQSKNAATALQRLASGEGSAVESSAASPDDDEAEMREMFRKMREFNAKNPAMLAKLWDEERRSHESAEKAPAATPFAPPQQPSPKVASRTAVVAQAKVQQPPKPAAPPKATKAAPAPNSSTAQQPATPQPRPSSNPQPQQGNNSLWPPHKKGALAEVTTSWLLSLPENAGKSIEPKNFLAILDANPSYMQLCELIESYGLLFDRSTLARELLKAVPDGMKGQSIAKPATPLAGTNGVAVIADRASTASPNSLTTKGKQKMDEPLNASKSATTVDYEAPMSLSDVAREVNTMHKQPSQPVDTYGSPTFQSRYFRSSARVTNGSRPTSSTGPAEIKPMIKPEEPPRPPADKEEAARKRTFGDLVDLTVEESDEEEGPPPKKLMVPSNAPLDGMDSQHRDPLAYLAKPMSFQQFMYPGQKGPQPVSSNFAGSSSKLFSEHHLSHQQAHANSVASAQARSSPPAHATNPVPLPPRPKGPTPEQLQSARMRGKMLVEPIMRDRVARKSNYDSRTIARDVLLATGRHPDMRGLNAHLSVMQKLLGKHGGDIDGGMNSDLGTIRWDVIDPEPVKEVKDKGPQKLDEAADDERNATNARAPFALQNGSTVQSSPPSLPPKKRRGRPPRSSLTNPEDARTKPPSTSRPATSSIDVLSSSTMADSVGKPVGYSAFAQIGPDGKRKKGRPFGWRAAVHSRAAQGLPAATTHHKGAGTLGRPPKNASSPAAAAALQEPTYHVYRCEWGGCKSELHNFETLKKHIVKVHGRQGEDGLFECRWLRCEDDYAGRLQQFEEIEGWVGHVDRVHLAPIKWRLGDGPAVGDRSIFREHSEIPRYLTDAHGRAVTPVITPPAPAAMTPAIQTPHNLHQGGQQPPTFPVAAPGLADPPRATTSPVPRPPGRPPGDGIPKHLRPPSTAASILDAELRTLETQQRIVGPTMGKMGCVLADEGRRRTFLDDEDFVGEEAGSEHEAEE